MSQNAASSHWWPTGSAILDRIVPSRRRRSIKISKTDYMIWRDCPHNAWAKIHLPELYYAEPRSTFDTSLLDTGNEIDELARALFPGGRLIGRDDVRTTRAFVAERYPVLYQPVFETQHLTTACDILVWNAASAAYDLYEVKASTNNGATRARTQDYLHDLAFQADIVRQNDVPLGRLHLVRLDSNYERNGELDIHALLTREDLTSQVDAIRDDVRFAIDAAHEFLSVSREPAGPCSCLTKGRSNHCTTAAHWNPDVPAYSVHDIARIGASPKKLAGFVAAGVLDIRDVPADADLSETQLNQVRAAKTGRAAIDVDAIAEFLSDLTFPLAFIDYETFPSAVPRFDGYHPFDQIPFQFSLDIVAAPGAEPMHHEFLARSATCPDQHFVSALRANLPDRGSIVVWNKTFETGINTHLARRNPEHANYFASVNGDSVNGRVVDLADVFTHQAYVDPGFRGRTSIKSVLPVLVPALSYKSLTIQEGASASQAWDRMVSGQLSPAEADRMAGDLLAYCALDTRAMVEIWRVLAGIAERSEAA